MCLSWVPRMARGSEVKGTWSLPTGTHGFFWSFVGFARCWLTARRPGCPFRPGWCRLPPAGCLFPAVCSHEAGLQRRAGLVPANPSAFFCPNRVNFFSGVGWMLVGRLRAGWRPSLAAHQTCVLVTIGGAAVLTQCFLYHPPPHAQKPAKKKKENEDGFHCGSRALRHPCGCARQDDRPDYADRYRGHRQRR